MADVSGRTLQVGYTADGEVVILDDDGIGHTVLSIQQARDLARILLQFAYDAEQLKTQH